MLAAAIVSLWIRREPRIWGGLAALSVLVALFSGRLQPIALAAIAILAGLVVWMESGRPRGERIFAGICTALLSVALAIHVVPGFRNLLVLDAVRFSEDSLPYTLYLNFDKPFIGLFLLAFGPALITGFDEWRRTLKELSTILIAALIALLGMSFLLGYVRFDPKLPAEFLLWAPRNLLFTCVAEEAFFRGFLQRKLLQTLPSSRNAQISGVAMIAIVFGAAHFAGGPSYVLLSSLAGFAYGWSYFKTGRIEAAILCHFAVNATHFLLFSYPALAI